MDLGIGGRTAFITGAGGGIGAAIARALAREGVRVGLVDIAPERAGEQAEALVRDGFEAIGLGADVTDAGAVGAAVEAVGRRFGPVDILINNAGFTRDSRIVNMDEAAWDAVIDVILKGAYLCTRAAIPAMIERRWGRIVNISSRAYLGNPGQANYSAAKAGIIGFTRAMALEHGRHSITVNAVAPGIIDTAAVRALAHYEKVRDNAVRSLPLPRLGEVEDVADTAAFLASERASYITGDVLHVSGGRFG